MPINTDLNVSPYFDDFDETKNYHRILFRPSTAVQARELTQLQTILQNQIERFGNWAFKNGDIVSGCTITDIPVSPYIRLDDYQSNGSSFLYTDLEGCLVVSNTSNLQARVLKSVFGYTVNYPNTNVLYLKYENTGTSGETEFSNTDQLTFYVLPSTGNTVADTVAVINVFSNSVSNTYSSGNSHAISVSDGIVFLNGAFVRVEDSTFGVVNNFGTNAGNNVVGFQGLESIISENEDSSLNDNALGYENENAPGAHRLKITPTLVSLSTDEAANTEGFNPIATYNFGKLISKSVAGTNVYSILGDAINKRTYEESGNYVVNPFIVDTVSDSPANSSFGSNGVFARVSPGLGYALGSRVALEQTAHIDMRRGIDLQTNESQQITFNYGSYFVLNEVAGSFSFDKAQQVDLYDTYQKSITNRSFSLLTPTGNKIGTALVRCFSFNSGVPGTSDATYLLHVFDIKLDSGYNSRDIKSVYSNSTIKAVGDLAIEGLSSTQNKAQIFWFGNRGIKNLRDSANNINTEYVYRTKSTTTLTSTGNATITLTSSAPGGTDILPYGVGILADSDATAFSLIFNVNAVSSALSGTVNVSNSSISVSGNGTSFTTDFIAGDQIQVGSDRRTIETITNSTSLTVDAFFSTTTTGASYYKWYNQGKIVPIYLNSPGPTGYVNVKNSTSFDISSGISLTTSASVDIVYDVLRTSAVPASKTINKDRFVKINTTTNPKGPWCLGISDIHKISKIYGSSSATYTTSGVDITKNFVFDTGQKDTHYDYGYLYAKTDISSTPYLLVQLDYFTANTSSGIGFFTVESYPVDDANTSNTNAIQTKDIPLYVDESGRKIALRDSVDFRVYSNNTANNTGVVDISNTSQVTTAIGYATINPSNTLVLSTSSSLNIPSYSQNFESDYTMYLPRTDLVMMTPDNKLKVKEGVSSITPQTPLFPDNAMPLCALYIPPYPSLSSDQLDELVNVNKLSKNLIRDTSTSISSRMVTNRRYTMKDIGKLDKRITNLEYYQQLSLLEKKASDMTITDKDGLDRFKNGIFVDSFSDFSLGDISNPEYSIAIDNKKGVARPRIIREIVNIKFNSASSTNTQKTGRIITLPYTELPFIVQPYSTKYRAASSVSFAWNGNIILVPSYDNHGDPENTGSINITVDNTTGWKEFAQGPFGSIWGDWKTTTNVLTDSVITGTQNSINIDLGHVVGSIGRGEAGQLAAAKAAVEKYFASLGVNGVDYIRGNVSYQWGRVGVETFRGEWGV